MRHHTSAHTYNRSVAIALAIMAYDVEYGMISNDNGKGFVCGKALYMWTTNEGECWTFTYHTPMGTTMIDYVQTMRYFPNKDEAQEAMAGMVWTLNGCKGDRNSYIRDNAS